MQYVIGFVLGLVCGSAVLAGAQYWPPVAPGHGYGPGQAQYERDQQEQTLREMYLRQQLQHGMRPPC